MSQIDSITMFFENLETVTINSKDIGILCINDICQRISRTAGNAIEQYYVSNSFAIELRDTANTSDIGLYDTNETVFDRILQYDDIVLLQINYKDRDDTLDIYLDWENDDETAMDNINQKSNLHHGNLYVVVEKNPNLYKYFHSEVESFENT